MALVILNPIVLLLPLELAQKSQKRSQALPTFCCYHSIYSLAQFFLWNTDTAFQVLCPFRLVFFALGREELQTVENLYLFRRTLPLQSA